MNVAQLWAVKLVYEGEAYKWLPSLIHWTNKSLRDAVKD